MCWFKHTIQTYNNDLWMLKHEVEEVTGTHDKEIKPSRACCKGQTNSINIQQHPHPTASTMTKRGAGMLMGDYNTEWQHMRESRLPPSISHVYNAKSLNIQNISLTISIRYQSLFHRSRWQCNRSLKSLHDDQSPSVSHSARRFLSQLGLRPLE